MPAPGDRAARITPREWVSALACGVVLTALLTHPTVAHFATGGRLDTNDGKFSIWNVAWVAHALSDRSARLFDANIFYPHRSTLTYSELNLVAGVLALPVYVVTRNPIAALNSAILLALFMCYLAMWALVRRLTGSNGAGLVAAAAYTFSAFTSSHTAQVQLLMIFALPLGLLAFHRLAQQPGLRTSVELGAAVAVAALACGYYGIYLAGMLGIAAIGWATRRRAYWLALGGAAVVAAALVAPIVVPYLRDRAAEGAGAVRGTNTEELRTYSADMRAHLTSSTALDVKWYGALYRPGERPREVVFPGLMVLALAAIGAIDVVKRRSAQRPVVVYAVIAAVAFWASLGPAGGLYPLLVNVVPGMSFLRVPARAAIVDIFALCVIAGFGYARVAERRGWVVALSLIAVASELWVPWPLQTLPPVPNVYRVLAGLPRGPVVELPFPFEPANFHQHAKAMLMSTFHWQPLVNGYSDYIPPDFERIAAPLNQFPDRQSFDIMHERQVRYVIWRLPEYGPYMQDLLARLPLYQAYLRLVAEDQGIRLYEIVRWPPAGVAP